ncbi:hypothetical protein ACQCT5_04995 [Sutcliffiella halmapala]
MKDLFKVREVQKVHHQADERPFKVAGRQKVHHQADEGPFHGAGRVKGPSSSE